MAVGKHIKKKPRYYDNLVLAGKRQDGDNYHVSWEDGHGLKNGGIQVKLNNDTPGSYESELALQLLAGAGLIDIIKFIVNNDLSGTISMAGNELIIGNANESGVVRKITAKGSATDIDVNIIPKGAGKLLVNGAEIAIDPEYRELIAFNTDLDTNSPPILMKGLLSTFDMDLPQDLTKDNTDLFVKMDGDTSYTAITRGVTLADTITNFLAWVNTNVTSADSWFYKVGVSPAVGFSGETGVRVIWKLA